MIRRERTENCCWCANAYYIFPTIFIVLTSACWVDDFMAFFNFIDAIFVSSIALKSVFVRTRIGSPFHVTKHQLAKLIAWCLAKLIASDLNANISLAGFPYVCVQSKFFGISSFLIMPFVSIRTNLMNSIETAHRIISYFFFSFSWEISN